MKLASGGTTPQPHDGTTLEFALTDHFGTESSPRSLEPPPTGSLRNEHHTYESIGVPPDVDKFPSFVGSFREPSFVAPPVNDGLTYPSAMSSLTTKSALITSKVATGLKRVWTSWFAGNSVNDYITKGIGVEEKTEPSGGKRSSLYDSDEEDSASVRRYSNSRLGDSKMVEKHHLKVRFLLSDPSLM